MSNQGTKLLHANSSGVESACEMLHNGDLVAFPTETVYGLGADARNDRAIAGIFEAKGRPRFNPLIVHVCDLETARQIAEFDPLANALADAFWPGPLTLVLPLRPSSGIAPLVTAGLPSVAIRVPAHPLAQQLLRAFGGPLAAPSANPSGKLSPTTAAHVLAGLEGRIAAVLDGGACPVGVESTILRTEPTLALLRPGGVSAEAIEDRIGQRPARPAPNHLAPDAPGQLKSHYAPKARIRLNATEAQEGEVLLGFGAVTGHLNLSPTGDLVEAAANLFGYLQELDATAAGQIAVAPIPDSGLGAAINDRLVRAAAPRPE